MLVANTKLEWGTDWDSPLELSFRTDPLLETIFFMTDGNSGPNSMDTANKWSQLGRQNDLKINVTALMEPSTEKAMERLFKHTRVQFSIVDQHGNAEAK